VTLPCPRSTCKKSCVSVRYKRSFSRCLSTILAIWRINAILLMYLAAHPRPSLLGLPQEIRDRILEFCLSSGSQLSIHSETGIQTQSVSYSCTLPVALQATNKQLRCESRLAWSRKHYVQVGSSVQPSIQDTLDSSLPTQWISQLTRTIRVSISVNAADHIQENRALRYQRDNLTLLLVRTLNDLLQPQRFFRVDLQIVLSAYMDTGSVVYAFKRMIRSRSDTSWDATQIIPLDRWLLKSRVCTNFKQTVDGSTIVSGTVTVLAPWRYR